MSKRKSLSLSEKINLLKDVDKGMKNKEVSRKYEIAPSSVSTILKNRDSILKIYETCGDFKKRSRGCKYEDIDKAVLNWVKMVQDGNVPIAGSLIKEKAAYYAVTFGHEDFQASSGWLDKFKKRHRIKEKLIPVESGYNASVCVSVNEADITVNEADITVWKDTVLKSILEVYNPNDIFNADETGLFFKCLPNETLSFKVDKCFGGKNSKERVTVLVGTNMTGSEKLKLLVIGNSKQPRCFRGVKTLEVDYDFNKKSWMTTNIFKKWIVCLDKRMRKQKRNIALFIDNCPAHPPSVASKLQNIKIVFFPTNSTSILQPMVHGIIKNLKMHYRKCILRRLCTALEMKQSLKNVINLRISITELAKVWQNDVTESTIKNCFAKAGFVKPIIRDRNEIENVIKDQYNYEESVPMVIEKYWDELQCRGVVSENISLKDFLNIDDGLVIAEYPTDKDLLNSLQRENAEVEDIEMKEEEDDDDDDVEDQVIKPSKQTILAAFDILRQGFQSEESVPDEIFQCLNKCEHFYEELPLNRLVQEDMATF